MALYQGRALREGPRRRSGGRLARVLRVLGVLAALVALAHLPWRPLLSRYAIVGAIHVDGLRYLDEARVLRAAGVRVGEALPAVDCARARQALLRDPRVAGATVERRWPRSLAIHVVERLPVLLVQHGVPWEIDSAGVLLPPLAEGVVADVPLLTGPSFDAWPPGTQVRTREVERGLSWVRALSDHELQLGGQVSEVDVSDPQATGLTLMSGTRVLSPAWPPNTRSLSALRVVLADLEQRGTHAREVDMRFDNQVIVRPAVTPEVRGASHTRNG